MFNIQSIISNLIYLIPAVLISLTIHECSHGYVSYLLGDNTAKSQGRLTLNPLKHLDPIGFIMMLIVGFGWAKPVPINPYFYRDRRKGVFLVSIAGPLSNVVLAFFVAIIYKLFPLWFGGSTSNMVVIYIFNLLGFLIRLNLTLAVFNLIPIPPLDGSKILMSVLPARQAIAMQNFERYSNIILILLLFTGALSGFLGKAVNLFMRGIFAILSFIPTV